MVEKLRMEIGRAVFSLQVPSGLKKHEIACLHKTIADLGCRSLMLGENQYFGTISLELFF